MASGGQGYPPWTGTLRNDRCPPEGEPRGRANGFANETGRHEWDS